MKVSLDSEVDAQQAADWYVDQDAWSAALAFQVELQMALARVAANPGLGTPGSCRPRVLPIDRFPYSLAYKVHGEDLRVIAVAGQRRRPGFWAARR